MPRGHPPAVHRQSALDHDDPRAQGGRRLLWSERSINVPTEAIAEAAQRPTMRFVPLKTQDQLDLQPLHRVRDRLVSRRTAVINQIRAFLLERGITFRRGRNHLQQPDPLFKTCVLRASKVRDRSAFSPAP